MTSDPRGTPQNPQGIPQDAVKQLILAALPDAQVELKDLTGTEDHYEARIVSEQFAGKTPLEQHRLVYAALGEAMNGPIHAISLRTCSPEPGKAMGAL